MSMSADILFEPLRIGSMALANRIVMAPMTRGFAFDGQVGTPHVDYYRRRADGGTGLIISEGVVVDRPASRNEPNVPRFHGEALAGWQAVVDSVQAAGGAMAPQLWHTGSVRSSTLTDWEPGAPVESPSGLIKPGDARGKAMTEEAVADTIAAFVNAAVDAKRLGFDSIELHGAHGYLIDQFFWSGTNLRDDAWGGPTVGERSQFAAEMVRQIRAAVGPDYPIIMRVSQWKQQDYLARLTNSPDEMAQWLLPLVEAGVDVLHCSQRRFWEAEFPEIDGEDGLNFAGWAKKLTGARTISVGSVGLSADMTKVFSGEGAEPASLDGLIRRMEKDEFDMVAVGRALIVDPQWANKVRDGRFDDLSPFKAEALASFA